MKFLHAGSSALLVECDSLDEAMALYRSARLASVAARDIVPAARTVMFEGVADPAFLQQQVLALDLATADKAPEGTLVEVPTRYDGADLADVARHWDMTEAEVVGTHLATLFTVAFCGFAPGFAYCVGLPERLSVPRRSHPRTRVPVGSVALAGEFTAVYPKASPGGWQLIGTTDLPVWDDASPVPTTLNPGTRVRFVQVGP